MFLIISLSLHAYTRAAQSIVDLRTDCEHSTNHSWVSHDAHSHTFALLALQRMRIITVVANDDDDNGEGLFQTKAHDSSTSLSLMIINSCACAHKLFYIGFIVYMYSVFGVFATQRSAQTEKIAQTAQSTQRNINNNLRSRTRGRIAYI